LNLQASGNVLPLSFVLLDTSNPDSCVQCTTGSAPIGVTGTWSRYAGGTPADDGLEAVSGEFPLVASIGCVVPIQCGNGAISVGNQLMPDVSGYAIAATTNSAVGAVALEPSAAAGTIIRCLVVILPGVATVPVAMSEEDALRAEERAKDAQTKAEREAAHKAREATHHEPAHAGKK
jgi:hypothetical protein